MRLSIRISHRDPGSSSRHPIRARCLSEVAGATSDKRARRSGVPQATFGEDFAPKAQMTQRLGTPASGRHAARGRLIAVGPCGVEAARSNGAPYGGGAALLSHATVRRVAQRPHRSESECRRADIRRRPASAGRQSSGEPNRSRSLAVRYLKIRFRSGATRKRSIGQPPGASYRTSSEAITTGPLPGRSSTSNRCS